MAEFDIPLNKIIPSENTPANQPLEAIIVGPKAATRLYVFTGIAIPDYNGDADDNLRRDTFVLNISKKYAKNFIKGLTDIAPIAYLATVHGNEDADQFTWAVDAVRSDIFVPGKKAPAKPGDSGELRVHMDMAVQGENTSLTRIAYQVNVTTAAVNVREVRVDPPVIRAGGEFGLVVFLDTKAPQTLQVTLEFESPAVLEPPIPSSIEVLQGNDQSSPKTLRTNVFSQSQFMQKVLTITAYIDKNFPKQARVTIVGA